MINNSYATYKRQSISTMTPMELIIKLYDECERQLNRAVHFIGIKNYAERNKAMMKALEIVEALQSSLDMKIEISKNLDALYNYFENKILQANIHNDIESINSITAQLNELRDAFAQISKMPKDQMMAQSNAVNLDNIIQ